jgi:hypothetical protein
MREHTNYDNLDILAEILEPAAEIFADPKVKELADGQMVKMAAYIIKNHKESVIKILAGYDGVPVEDYKCGVFTPIKKLLEIFNDPEMKELFTSQA